MARRVLLIDDDRLQQRLTEALFRQFKLAAFELDWADTYDTGLGKLLGGGYAACLLDYQLGSRDGLALIREAVAAGNRTPIIFLTAETGEGIDLQAMEAGALDYLIKGEFNARSLERSLRYAVKLGETLEALRLLATRDELTGLLNRRAFDQALAEEEERVRRFQRSLAVVLLDIDHFKRINDGHGHAAGDGVLKEVSRRLAAGVRSVDRLARYGGEEFAVLVPEADARGACAVAERLVERVAAEPVMLPDGTALRVTISAGCAEGTGEGVRRERLVEAADRALYAAKAAGRNRAVSG
jgi:diguanylate cyclase (GGDEF)-like protein